MLKFAIALGLTFWLSLTGLAQNKEPVDYVNTIIGASTSPKAGKAGHGLGKTFPGAATPFGLVQLSPDTMTGGDNGPGYSWHMSTIEGFSFTHMSGIGWYGDFGNFLVMPTCGKLYTSKGTPPKEDMDFGNDLHTKPIKGWRSKFSHDTEVTKAGYYAVTLDDYNIRTELTATPHAGIIRFTYPESETSRIQIDLSRRIGGVSKEQFVEKLGDFAIRGWMDCPYTHGGWGQGSGKVSYKVHFYAKFSEPLKNFGIWKAQFPEGFKRNHEVNTKAKAQEIIANAKVYRGLKKAQGEHLGFFTEFATRENQKVLMKVGISFVSMENAEENLKLEIPDWNFEKVARNARKTWNEALSKIEVEGASEREKTIFYTALYHAMIDPRAASDANGQYMAGDGKVHTADGFVYRTIFSGWDVFRSEFPLLTIIAPDVVNDEINSLIQLADLSGRKLFPRWEIMNSYSGCMLGDPAVSVLADAYAKGIRNYDAEKAYEYAANTNAKRDGSNINYKKYGYVPNQVSHTLELAYSDWCMGRLSELMNKPEEAKKYYEGSKNYKNIWNEKERWFTAKDKDGNFLPFKGKTVHNQGCTESNNFQQGWFIAHDIEGAKKLMGEDFFLQELETFFEKTPADFLWNDYYNHPNEPNHQVPFMFNYTKKPYLTQKWSRTICDKAYGDDVLGLVGNDDVGQMSAWYVLASSGLHPVCPGSTRYEITSPVFKRVKITLNKKYHKGKFFEIIAKNNSPENIYIRRAWLNGKPLNRLWLDHFEITAGGKLELEMSDKPNAHMR